MISAIIPVYNAQNTLDELYERLKLFLEKESVNFEIIMVEDGGNDNSWNIISKLANSDKRVKGIRLGRNFGQHSALLCGIRQAAGEIIITLDDDLQNPPEEIPVLLEKLKEGYDVVYGTPERKQHGMWRNLASHITRWTLKSIMGAEVASKVSAFRALRSRICNSFNNYHSPFVSVDVLLTWGTNRFASVNVRHNPRQIGTSNYSLRKLVSHALDMLTGYSSRPLRAASLVGFSFTFFGIFILTYVIGRFLIVGGSVPGFPFLASIVAIFSGAQLFALGVIGEYISRIHFRSMDRPVYFIRDITFENSPNNNL